MPPLHSSASAKPSGPLRILVAYRSRTGSQLLPHRSNDAIEQLTAVLRPEELAALDRKVETNLRRLSSSESSSYRKQIRATGEAPRTMLSQA